MNGTDTTHADRTTVPFAGLGPLAARALELARRIDAVERDLTALFRDAERYVDADDERAAMTGLWEFHKGVWQAFLWLAQVEGRRDVPPPDPGAGSSGAADQRTDGSRQAVDPAAPDPGRVVALTVRAIEAYRHNCTGISAGAHQPAFGAVSALADGDYRRAAELAREALAQWEGWRDLADVTRRLAAVADCIDRPGEGVAGRMAEALGPAGKAFVRVERQS